MSEILQEIESPAWWFSTIVVAIIANILANYIYDALKAKVAGNWQFVLTVSVWIVFVSLYIASIFTLPMELERAVPYALGIALASVVGFYEIYQIPGYAFAQIVTVVIVFSLTFHESGFPKAWADRDFIWFGQQYFYCFTVSIVIQILIHMILYRRYLRKRRGLRK